MIQYYETGRRGSKKVVIPRSVELACYAVAVGVERFDGPLPEKSPVPLPARTDPPDDKKSRLGGQEAA
jgi:hypothetical protein